MSVSIANLETVAEKCGANVPGVTAIQLIKSNFILFIPQAVGGVISGNIIILAGESAVSWAPTKQSAVFMEERKTNEDFGDFYEQRLLFDLPKNDALKTRQHVNAANTRISAIVTDENGVSSFIHRLRHRSKKTTGGNGERNGFEWEFLTESKTPAFLFTGTFQNIA